jgi:uncharacterized protein
VKLAVKDSAWRELMRFLGPAENVLTAEISEVETVRAASRVAGEPGALAAHRVLATFSLVEMDRRIRRRATELGPPLLRSLDAIHLATALSLEYPNVVMVGYDRRLLDAAAAAGLETASPGV